MDLALFDLDHTLLPIDSDYEWGRFLVRVGAVDPEHQERENDRFYRDYQAGTLDIAAFLAFQLAPLGAHPPQQLRRWHDQYMAEVIEPALRPQARALVDEHRGRGDLCAIITATNEFVTRPIARAFGVDELLAIELERGPDGWYTGEIRGTPSFREGKVTRLRQWLAERGLGWDDVDMTFYSDSTNDLPLLEKAHVPVATNPGAGLRAIAQERGWRILDLFPEHA